MSAMHYLYYWIMADGKGIRMANDGIENRHLTKSSVSSGQMVMNAPNVMATL